MEGCGQLTPARLQKGNRSRGTDSNWRSWQTSLLGDGTGSEGTAPSLKEPVVDKLQGEELG